MYQTKKTFIKPEMKMAGLIFENPSLLIMLEHFDIDIIARDKSVAQVCSESNINSNVFVVLSNLYNGFSPVGYDCFTKKDVESVIFFLKNSHVYYLNDKIPEIQGYIKELYVKNIVAEVKLIEDFFQEYASEVKEHLDYEDDVAFPYFFGLLKPNNEIEKEPKKFSVKEYRDHHSDIETKLADLKNLLLKYIPLKSDRKLRRKLLFSLFDLEFDLSIHSKIEELILMPEINKIEKNNSVG